MEGHCERAELGLGGRGGGGPRPLSPGPSPGMVPPGRRFAESGPTFPGNKDLSWRLLPPLPRSVGLLVERGARPSLDSALASLPPAAWKPAKCGRLFCENRSIPTLSHLALRVGLILRPGSAGQLSGLR